MHKYKIKDPIYGAEIFLFMASYDEFCDYLKKLDSAFPLESEYYPSGRVIRVKFTKKNWITRKYYLWIPSFEFYGNQYQALVHEVNHLAMMVFDMKGITIYKDDANEAFCYYADYLFGEFMKEIDKGNAKIKSENLKSCKEALDYMKEKPKEKKSGFVVGDNVWTLNNYNDISQSIIDTVYDNELIGAHPIDYPESYYQYDESRVFHCLSDAYAENRRRKRKEGKKRVWTCVNCDKDIYFRGFYFHCEPQIDLCYPNDPTYSERATPKPDSERWIEDEKETT